MPAGLPLNLGAFPGSATRRPALRSKESSATFRASEASLQQLGAEVLPLTFSQGPHAGEIKDADGDFALVHLVDVTADGEHAVLVDDDHAVVRGGGEDNVLACDADPHIRLDGVDRLTT